MKNNFCQDLLFKISELGKKNFAAPHLKDLSTFQHFFKENGDLIREKLDELDGQWTRRELLARALLVSAVLDQGPDIDGVRIMVKNVANELYKKEIRIFHKPIDFFKEIGISIDSVISTHESIRSIRADSWAQANQSSPQRYSLFFAPTQQFTSTTKQVLEYTLYRWGVPLLLPYLLEKDVITNSKETNEPLVDYLESWPSSEIMSQQIKDHERYGLGKVIGDKAAHLFAKWYIHSYKINKRKDSGWSKWSYELPLDSNAGRVLFRSGFLSGFVGIEELKNWNVIQKGGRGEKDYIRVTNLRGQKIDSEKVPAKIFDNYKQVVLEYTKTRVRSTQRIEIQILPNAFLLNSEYGIGDLDDGLIHIGTKMCYNHDNPKCPECPIKNLCKGTKKNLIKNYRT